MTLNFLLLLPLLLLAMPLLPLPLPLLLPVTDTVEEDDVLVGTLVRERIRVDGFVFKFNVSAVLCVCVAFDCIVLFQDSLSLSALSAFSDLS